MVSRKMWICTETIHSFSHLAKVLSYNMPVRLFFTDSEIWEMDMTSLDDTTLNDTSLHKLATCDDRLQALVTAVAARIPCVVLEGHRGQQAQDAAYAAGKTKLRWPHGNHNATPSRAVDLAPAPVDWNDRERFTLFAGFVLGTAAAQGVSLRWGGDWNGNFNVADNSFDDLVHFELKGD
jgi:peptidoglycan LD-endopeptidase CwlK